MQKYLGFSPSHSALLRCQKPHFSHKWARSPRYTGWFAGSAANASASAWLRNRALSVPLLCLQSIVTSQSFFLIVHNIVSSCPSKFRYLLLSSILILTGVSHTKNICFVNEITPRLIGCISKADGRKNSLGFCERRLQSIQPRRRSALGSCLPGAAWQACLRRCSPSACPSACPWPGHCEALP